MLAASVAFLGALVYGSADFLGGLAARRLRPLLVTAVAAFSGVLVLAIASPVLGGVWRAEDVAWGAASGLAGAVAVGLLYACLAIGPMSVLSPLTAVVSAVAPMLWGSSSRANGSRRSATSVSSSQSSPSSSSRSCPANASRDRR